LPNTEDMCIFSHDTEDICLKSVV